MILEGIYDLRRLAHILYYCIFIYVGLVSEWASEKKYVHENN